MLCLIEKVMGQKHMPYWYELNKVHTAHLKGPFMTLMVRPTSSVRSFAASVRPLKLPLPPFCPFCDKRAGERGTSARGVIAPCSAGDRIGSMRPVQASIHNTEAFST